MSVEFIAQPPCSPDMNACDLGALNSLARGVKPIRSLHDQEAEKPVWSLMKNVIRRWLTWDAMTRLERIFQSKTRVMRAVFNAKGSNEYSMPRGDEQHVADGPTYDPRSLEGIEVDLKDWCLCSDEAADGNG